MLVFTTSCCLKKYDIIAPTLVIELRDRVSGEDLFANGTYNIDSVTIASPDWDDVHLQFQEEQNETQIFFGLSQEHYIFSVGSQLTFDIFIDKSLEEKMCYNVTKVNDVTVEPFEFEATSDESLIVWNIIVWVD